MQRLKTLSLKKDCLPVNSLQMPMKPSRKTDVQDQRASIL